MAQWDSIFVNLVAQLATLTSKLMMEEQWCRVQLVSDFLTSRGHGASAWQQVVPLCLDWHGSKFYALVEQLFKHSVDVVELSALLILEDVQLEMQ